MIITQAAGAAGETVSDSGVSWAAIIAGGVSAAAISVILLLFGTGLGLSSISPWAGNGVSVAGFTVLAAIWLIIVQWIAAMFGGYMAGRLRTKWTGVHTDEVFFRDTAHGFLAWALATLMVVGVIALASGAGIKSGAQVAEVTAATSMQNSYYVEELFRQNNGQNKSQNTSLSGAASTASPSNGASVVAIPAPAAPGPASSDLAMRREADTILAHGAITGGVTPGDRDYLAQLVSTDTGLALADAKARVADVVGQENAAIVKAKQVADAARKASAALAIYTFVSLLIGAFIASVAGAIGGRLRDTY